MHGRAYKDYRVDIEESIKSDTRAFFGYVDLKKTCRLPVGSAFRRLIGIWP
jgi:hypothetical protein